MGKFTKIVSCAVALALVVGGAASAAKWSFGVMADSQWTTSDAVNNPNTVAVGIINQLNTQFINKGVKFVVQVGDLCDNGSTAGLQTRLNANSALTSAGIKFYGLRGNHESSSTAQTFFKNNYIPTSNANSTVALAPDATSYAVTYNNTKLVLLDISVAGNVTNLNTQTSWMDSQLKAADHNQAFVFSHKNLLGQNHKDNLFGSSNEANPTQQNAFIASLDNNNVHYYMSGHDHIHNRSIVASPDGLHSVEQLICASDSYKFSTPKTPYSTRETPISQELYTIGYYIFSVDGNKVDVDFYSSPHGQGSGDVDLTMTPNLTFRLRESWGYDNVAVPEPSSILVLLSGVIGLGGFIIRGKR